MRKRNNLVKKEFRENYKKYIEDLKKRSKEVFPLLVCS
jgi:hypothetical protein